MTPDPVREAAPDARAIAGWMHQVAGCDDPAVISIGLECRSASNHVQMAQGLLNAFQAAGYTIAPPGDVVVRLPEPVITGRVCGCGRPPDGAPSADGCSAECMAPETVEFGGLTEIDLRDPVVYATRAAEPGLSAGSWSPDEAREVAAALLAGARYREAHAVAPSPPIRLTISEATPAPESGGAG